VAISELDGATRATIHLGMEATVRSLRPWHFELRAPAVVKELMQPPLMAYAGSTELTDGWFGAKPDRPRTKRTAAVAA